MTTYAQGYMPTAEDEKRRKELEAQMAASSTAMPDIEAPAAPTASQPTATPSAPTQPAPQPSAPTQPQPGMTAQSYFMPPPPPPPAPPPPMAIGQTMQATGAQTMQAPGGLDLEGYAADWMANPNRFLSDLVTSTRASGEQQRALQEQDAMADIGEWASSRGLVGSSYEGDQVVGLQSRLDAARSEEERQLLEMLATSESMDRLAAGELGLGVNEQRLQERALDQRESEFARSFGLDERQFSAEQDQFAKQFGEQVAARLQNDAQFGKTLAQQDAQFAVDTGLREKALDLQAQGLTMEDAFRRAALDQERELTTSAQELQRYGIDTESAYRFAALTQDAGFRQRALDLQEQGMGLDEAYRAAELEFRQEDAERRDQAARMAILVQAMGVLGQTGLGNTEDLWRMIMEGVQPASTPADDAGTPPPGTGTPSNPGGGTPGGATYGPNGDMTYEEYVAWLMAGNRGDGVE